LHSQNNEIIIKITFNYPSSRHVMNDIIQEYIHKKKFQDTKRGNQRGTSKKDRQCNGQNKKKTKGQTMVKNAILYKRCISFFLFYFFRCLSFPFYLNVFFPLSLPRLWQVLTVDMSNTEEAKTAYPSRAPTVFHLFSFFFIVVSCTISSVLRCTLRFPYKTMFGSSLSPVVCRRTQVLFTLFVLFMYSGVQHILFFLFVFFYVHNVAYFSLFSIIDCSFGIL